MSIFRQYPPPPLPRPNVTAGTPLGAPISDPKVLTAAYVRPYPNQPLPKPNFTPGAATPVLAGSGVMQASFARSAWPTLELPNSVFTPGTPLGTPVPQTLVQQAARVVYPSQQFAASHAIIVDAPIFVPGNPLAQQLRSLGYPIQDLVAAEIAPLVPVATFVPPAARQQAAYVREVRFVHRPTSARVVRRIIPPAMQRLARGLSGHIVARVGGHVQ